ncbi:MAG: ABC transporter permease subunit [Pseudomonadota bacterium]
MATSLPRDAALAGKTDPGARGLRFVPLLTLLVLIGPVVAGVFGTIAPAFGLFPALTGAAPGMGGFDALFAWPGFSRAVWTSVTTGLVSAALSLAIVIAITAAWQGSPAFRAVERFLSPLLAVPHAAAAFGLAFLIAPSGWIMRIFSPWATGFEQPPDWLVINDPGGLALIAGLVAKETPFLMLMTIAALSQADAARSMVVARGLGYWRGSAWLLVVFPRVYRQIRLPVYVVIAYAMTVVDTATILGPTTPPTLSVQLVRWMNDPDLSLRTVAAAAALIQLWLVLAALALWRMGEMAAARLGCRWAEAGWRGPRLGFLRPGTILLAFVSSGAIFLGLLVLALWSVAGLWSFPDAFPGGVSIRSWARHGPELLSTVIDTVAIAGAASVIAIILVIGCLEAEQRYGLTVTSRGLWLLYLPLLVPQIAFLPGLQTAMLLARTPPHIAAVIGVHVVFVVPYVFLSFGDAFRAWDRRYGVAASALGAGPDAALWRVRLPMLLAPALTALAVGFAVSVGQFLPTLLVGGGRITTLTTEAVALASGGDRRTIAVYALAQTATALLPFALALGLPRLLWANRRGLRHD